MIKLEDLEKQYNTLEWNMLFLKDEINKLKKQETTEIEIKGDYYISINWMWTRYEKGHKSEGFDPNRFETKEEAVKFGKYICVLRKIVAIVRREEKCFEYILEFLYETFVNGTNDTLEITKYLTEDEIKIVKDGLL